MMYQFFLYRFELLRNGIDFVLNEAIAEDMYPDIDEKMKLLVHVCCKTLLRYRHLSVSNTIMDGSFLAKGEFEIMLSKGLGRHFLSYGAEVASGLQIPLFLTCIHACWACGGR